MDKYSKAFGSNLKHIRKEKGISQAMLGEKLNLPQSAISNYESGKFQPNISLLCQISDILGVSYNKLLKQEAVCEKNS